MLINQKFHCRAYDRIVTHSNDCVNCPLYNECEQRIGSEGMFLPITIVAMIMVVIWLIFS